MNASIRILTGILATSLVGVVASKADGAVIYGNTDDTNVFFNSPAVPTDGGGTVQVATAALRSGRGATTGTPAVTPYFNTVWVVQLPSLGAVVNPFATAQFGFTISATNSVNAFDASLNHDLYGLPRRSASAVLPEDFYLGGSDTTNATLLGGNIVSANASNPSVNTPRNANDVSKTTTGVAVVNYLNAQYAGGAGAGEYVFFRLNVEKTNGSEFDIDLYSAAVANDAFKPQVNYTEVPEPATIAVLGLVGAWSLSRRRVGRRNA